MRARGTRGATGGVDNVAVALAELTKKLDNFMMQRPNQPATDARRDSVPKTRKGWDRIPLFVGNVARLDM